MKRWPVVLLVMLLALGAVVPGCRHVPQYYSRLTAADSLLRTNPDSALAIVDALAADSLTTEADLAYHALLLTQACYKCYKDITTGDDSDINRALAYYKKHPAEREKLTRAYIYKGAVMEELGHPDSAMLYYKTAEATAAPDDYFNLGYSKMRMGALYRDNYTMDGRHIMKYHEALECLKHTDNRHYQLVCMINLGSLYCLKEPFKADSILNQALKLAEQLGDTANYIRTIHNLIKNDINKDRYHHARGLIWRVTSLKNPKPSVNFCLYSAQIYACLQIPDSAEYYLELAEGYPIKNEIDKISYWEAKAGIALAYGDTSSYLAYKSECKRKSDSLQSLNTPLSIFSVEDDVEHQSKLALRLSQQVSTHWNKILVSMVFIIMIAGSAFFIRRRISHQKQLRQLHMLLESAHSQIIEMKLSLNELKKLDIKDSKLKEFLNSYMGMMRGLMEECYHQPKLKHSQNIKNIIEFQHDNNNMWETLYDYIDIEYDGIISKTKANYPQLNDKELLLIALTTLQFSYIQIAMVLGYANATTISGNKQRVAKKMNLDCSLNDYINQFKSA